MSPTIGRYRLHDAVATGGMAVVHLGRLMGIAGFSRTVAIKRLHPHLAADPELVTMLLDEARLAARVRHPNVAPIFDVVLEKGEVCLVLEYVRGESLSRLLAKAAQRAEPVPVGIALAIISGALYGLSAAHEATGDDGTPLAIVHRDVSPQNILVGIDGMARVIDFGVAKATARLQTTQDGQMKGKLGYMAPEQLSASPIDARADLYAAGVVLWEALAGRRLFDTTELGAVVRRAVEATVDPPSLHAPEVGPAVDRIVLRALSLRPEDRFPSAQAMAQALAQAGPIAAPYEVAAWVRRVGGEELAAREARVAAIESGVDSEAAMSADPELPTAVPHSLPTTRAASPVRIGGIAAILLVVAVASTIGFVSRARTAPSGASVASSIAPPAIEGVPIPEPVGLTTAKAQEVASASPAPSLSTAAPPRRAATTQKPAPRATPTPAWSAHPSYCSQRKLAFTTGPDGIERPRPECM